MPLGFVSGRLYRDTESMYRRPQNPGERDSESGRVEARREYRRRKIAPELWA